MFLIVRIFLWLTILTIGVRCQSSKRGTTLIVTSVLDTPYTMLRDSPDTNLTGNDRYEGYVVDLMESVSKKLGFNYRLNINEGNSFGSFDKKSGRWNGMIGELIDGRADIATGSMSITAARENAVDFTVPFMNLGIGVLYKRYYYQRDVLDEFTALLHPFVHLPTDAFLLLTLVFGIILLILRCKYKTIISRILLVLFLLFLIIFVALFTAHLSSYYVNQTVFKTIVQEFSTIEELASQTSVVYGCIKGGSTESFFRSSQNPTINKMWLRMNASDPSVFVSTNAEGVERVQKGGYAFLAESTFIDYVTYRHCDLYQMGKLIDSKGYGLAVQGGSPIREPLSTAILTLREEGILSQLYNKWWRERNGGDVC